MCHIDRALFDMITVRQVAIFCGKTPDGEAKQAAAEFSRLLQFLSSGS